MATDHDPYDLSDGADDLLASLLDDIQARRRVPSRRPPPHDAPRAPSPADAAGALLAELSSQDPNADLRGAALLDETYTVPHEASPRLRAEAQPAPPTTDDAALLDDGRSPLERFRTAPKKPLSVTDLVSPAWCELQYWYSLVKFGRVRKTPAMKRGSSVHKQLEEQVHVAVPVEVQTKEDFWGLRLWNIIQSLRTLRATGLTRELELWGTVDGQVVNGVVDEVSWTCPDRELEAKLDASAGQSARREADQTSISQFFSSQDKGSTPSRKVYITDVKTRAAARPPAGASFRPTQMQLMLYRRLLVALATNSLDATLVFDRYGLDQDATFSDDLIRQLSALDINPRSDDYEMASLEADVDTVAELLGHNSLRQLWQLMIDEFRTTLPNGADDISPVLAAEFRRADDGSVIGTKTFAYDEAAISSYVGEEMRWWKGERAAKGVDIEEAYKCRICEFADACTWRADKIDEAVKHSRTRRRSARGGAAAG